MSARLSLFDAAWAAARMPLALPEYRTVFSEKPWRKPVSLRADPSICILPEDARGNSSILLMPPRAHGDCKVPATCRSWPSVEVMTTPDWVYDLAPRQAAAYDESAHYSTFYFGDRAGFARAYRAARMITSGRPAYDAIYGAPTYNERPYWRTVQMFSVVGRAHRNLASFELSCAHNSAVGITHFGQHGRYAPTACRVCGCTDAHACEEVCYWDEPDLCSVCRRQETGGPCEGFSGDCDRCNRRSRKLVLLPLTQYAMCPACRRWKEGR